MTGLAPEAFQGAAGAFVRAVQAETEADPAAILLHAIVFAGNVIGGTPHVRIGADRHRGNLNVVLVGATAHGRKGTAAGIVRLPFERAEEDWATTGIRSGFASGEAIINDLRDPTEKDPGAADRRLLVLEPEFARVLRTAGREGSILSAIIRQAWDGTRLEARSKGGGVQTATNPHMSIVGHVTIGELSAELGRTESINGFANRFLWATVHRTGRLPDGGDSGVIDAAANRFADHLRRAIPLARRHTEVGFAPAARPAWHDIYNAIPDDLGGLLDAVTARIPPIIRRLALVYAMIDAAPVVNLEHLAAAVAVAQFGIESAAEIFGPSTTDPQANSVIELVRSAPDGLLTTEIQAATHRHVSRLGDLLEQLEQSGFLVSTSEPGRGRPATRWRATDRSVAVPDLVAIMRRHTGAAS